MLIVLVSSPCSLKLFLKHRQKSFLLIFIFYFCQRACSWVLLTTTMRRFTYVTYYVALIGFRSIQLSEEVYFFLVRLKHAPIITPNAIIRPIPPSTPPKPALIELINSTTISPDNKFLQDNKIKVPRNITISELIKQSNLDPIETFTKFLYFCGISVACLAVLLFIVKFTWWQKSLSYSCWAQTTY